MLNKFSWAILCPVSAVLAIQPQLDLAAFVSLLLCFYAVFDQSKYICLVITRKELERLSENEMRLRTLIGSLVIFWVTIEHICQIVQSLL